MIKLYIYDTNTHTYSHTLVGPVSLVMDNTLGDYFTLTPPPCFTKTWKWEGNHWVKVDAVNDPNTLYGDGYIWNEDLNQWSHSAELEKASRKTSQEQMWEKIKERRLQAVTSGVYVESVDKWFHTDTVSATTYSTIGGMIALDNYEPLQWKVMDNTWLLLTVPLFKELQTAISTKTNAIYTVAEQHKAAMLQADNPLEYDFSTGWEIEL